MPPEQRKGLLLLFLAVAMLFVAPWAIFGMFADIPQGYRWIPVVLVLLIVILTWGFAARAVGEYQRTRWLREARGDELGASRGAATPDATPGTPRMQDFSPQPIGIGGIIVASIAAFFVASLIAEALLPHELVYMGAYIGCIAFGIVWGILESKRKEQVLRQTRLDSPPS